MRAYHRVDPLMDERKGHYSPAQLGAFLKVQLIAGRQSNRGRFRSLAALRGVLPAAYVKHLDFLMREGDILVNGDGSAYIDGWDEWQEGDLTVSDRMTALRNRKRNATVTGTVTDTVTPTVTRASPSANANASADASSFVGVGSGEGLPNLTGDVAAAWNAATGRSVIASGYFAQEVLDDVCLRHGSEKVVGAIRRARTQFQTVPAVQPMAAALRSILDPFPDAKAAAKAEREREAAAASRRGTAATLRRNHELGAHRDEPHGACPVCQEATA